MYQLERRTQASLQLEAIATLLIMSVLMQLHPKHGRSPEEADDVDIGAAKACPVAIGGAVRPSSRDCSCLSLLYARSYECRRCQASRMRTSAQITKHKGKRMKRIFFCLFCFLLRIDKLGKIHNETREYR